LGPSRKRSSALELLPTLQPEARGSEAAELWTVWPPELPGVVGVVAGGEVVGVLVAGGDVVGAPVAGGNVVGVLVAGGDVVGAPVAGGKVVGAPVAGGKVVVLAGGVAPVVLGLPGTVVVVTLPPGAALGTVVGLGLWEINLGTTRPTTRANTSTPATAAAMPTALRRPRRPPGGVGPAGGG
jgi:hypothetical protein